MRDISIQVNLSAKLGSEGTSWEPTRSVQMSSVFGYGSRIAYIVLSPLSISSVYFYHAILAYKMRAAALATLANCIPCVYYIYRHIYG